MDRSHLQFSHTYRVPQRSRRLTKHLQFERLFSIPSNRIWSWHIITLKQQIDQGFSKHKFVEGDQVFLVMQPYKKNSLKVENCQKLAPKFYGPYTALKHMGQVAYQLSMPNHSKLHHVFHVSCLEKVIGTRCQFQTSLPELAEEGSIWLHPEAVFD